MRAKRLFATWAFSVRLAHSLTQANGAVTLGCMIEARIRKMIEFLSNPILALVVGLAAIGIGLSGRFSVSTAQFVFVLGWVVFLVFLLSLKMAWSATLVSAIASVVVFFLMAAWFRPEVVPQNFGALIPQRKLLFYPSGTATSASLQVGDSPTTFVWKGEAGGAMFEFLSGDKLVVEKIGKLVKVSTVFRDESGAIVAELKRNEWRVAPAPNTWDRNYTADSLEVKDAKGRIILQIRVLPDRIQLQGIWRGERGSFFALFKASNGSAAIQAVQPGQSPPGGEPVIKPIFEYPSATHFGELIK